jgi:hypothetical protein
LTDIAKLSNVAYKKGNLMRYTLWGLAAICIAILIYTFISVMNCEVSATVPEGYKFSVSSSYNTNVRTTYYVYDDKVIVESEGFKEDVVDRSLMIYGSVNTSSLELNPEDTMELCEYGSCTQVPKVFVVIKNLLVHKIGREYIGL